MRTDQLIAALAADHAPAGRPGRGLAIALPLATLAVAVFFLARIGLRPGMATAPVLEATAVKLAITLAAALAGLALALRLADPVRGEDVGLRPLLLPALLLLAAIAGEFALRGPAGWVARMIGTNHWHCLLAVPLLAALPLAACLAALRQGAVLHPGRAGAMAGIAASGIGASLYALNCTDDSPLFVALWYGAATTLVAIAGALLGRRLLRW